MNREGTSPSAGGQVMPTGTSLGQGGKVCSTEKMEKRRRQARCKRKKKYSEPSAPKLAPFSPPQLSQLAYIPTSELVQQNATFSPPRLDMRLLQQRCKQGQYIAMDCEMVGIGPLGQQSVLARVSMVDWNGCALLDTFVRVVEPVTDYRTQVSGVRPGDLHSPLTLSFGTCRNLVSKLISGRILVGHGLENDLAVLFLSHPWVHIRDTATYKPLMKVGIRGQLCAMRLKELAHVHLGIQIQREGEEHDSVEDAFAAMQVFKTVQVEWEFATVTMNCSPPSQFSSAF